MLNAVTEEVFTVGSVVGDDWDTFGSVRSVGGRGEGPGEFGNVSTAIVARDGSYTVLGNSQIDLLESDGTFVRRIPVDAMILSNMALPDGRLVASRFLPMAELFTTGEFPEYEGRPIHVVPLDGSEAEVLYTAWELPEDPAASDASESSSPNTVRLSAGRAFEPGLYFDALTDGRLALTDSTGSG